MSAPDILACQAPSQEADLRDFVLLMKPNVMRLALFTGFVGMMLSPTIPHPVMGLAALLFMGLGAGACGALNMWWEHELDAKMPRTRNRPIPSGRMQPGEALGFGAFLAVASVAAMGLFINYLSAALLALTIIFYLFVYTIWLKPRTPHNIVIGGFAGALPPVIGWTAAAGALALEPVILALIIFLWTPPHFWALALHRQEDYAKAQIPMLPNEAGEKACRAQLALYSLLLAISALSPFFLGFSGWVFLGGAVLLNALLLHKALRLWRGSEGAMPGAMPFFFFSILYLFSLFALLLADRALSALGIL